MLGFNHVLAGSILGVIVPLPLTPFVAFASHFILDLTPHFGRSDKVYPYTRSFKWLLVTDALLCILGYSFAVGLFPDKWFVIGVGAFFSAFPDVLWALRHRGPKLLDKFLDWAEWIQWGERPYGWLFDAFYAFIMCISLYLLSR